MSFKLIHCVHRHCVFTIDDELLHFFLDDRSLLDCLFQAVRSVVLRLFHNLNKSNLSDTDTVIKYISRYLGHPVIALKRIDSYNGEHVTFHYNRHEDNSYAQKTLPALDFMRLLIQHIPEKISKWDFIMDFMQGTGKRINLCTKPSLSQNTSFCRVSLEKLYERTMAKAKCRSA